MSYLIKYNTRTGQKITTKSATYKEATAKAAIFSKRFACVSYIYEEGPDGYKLKSRIDMNGKGMDKQ